MSTRYVHVNVGSDELSANHNILQIVDVCEEHEKTGKLQRVLDEIMAEDCKNQANKIIIFAATKRTVDNLTRTMRDNG